MGNLKLDLSQPEEGPGDTSKFMVKPEEGGKGPPARQLKTVKGKSFTRSFALNMSWFDKGKPRQIYFSEAFRRFNVSLDEVYKSRRKQSQTGRRSAGGTAALLIERTA